MRRDRSTLTGSALSSRVAQWTQPGLIRSIQRGTITITSPALSATATITAVDTANARLRLLGFLSNNGGGFTPANSCVRLTLTNATTITASHAAAAGVSPVVSYEIVEYWPGVLRSVQRGAITVSGAASNTAAISAVNTAKTELDFLGNEPDDTSADANVYAYLTLTSGTVVTATRSGTTNQVIVSYQVVEFY